MMKHLKYKTVNNNLALTCYTLKLLKVCFMSKMEKEWIIIN